MQLTMIIACLWMIGLFRSCLPCHWNLKCLKGGGGLKGVKSQSSSLNNTGTIIFKHFPHLKKKCLQFIEGCEILGQVCNLRLPKCEYNCNWLISVIYKAHNLKSTNKMVAYIWDTIYLCSNFTALVRHGTDCFYFKEKQTHWSMILK